MLSSLPSIQTDTAIHPSASDMQLLVFSVGAEEYACALTDVREIIRSQELTPVPSAPASVRGVLNLRGKVVTILDLRAILGLPAGTWQPGAPVIITQQGKDMMGILVDDLRGVLRCDPKQLKALPDLLRSRSSAPLLTGVIVIEASPLPTSEAAKHERIILLLDVPKALSSVSDTRS